jgi:YVTN family beta-propeller protein
MNGPDPHPTSLQFDAFPGIAPKAHVRNYSANNLNRNRSLRAHRFAALWAMVLATGSGTMAGPGEALAWTGQPLAYVTSSNGISVIDTGDNQVVDTIPGPALPTAVAPDGKYVYAFGSASDLVANISIIDTTDDKVVATIPLDVSLVGGVSLDQTSKGIAVTPDGKDIYVTTGLCPFPAIYCHPEAVYFVLWEIDTATNKVVAASVGKGVADGIAFTPEGQHIFLTNFDPYFGSPQVLVLATGNSISSPQNVIPLPGYATLYSVAISPNGKLAYVPYSFYYGVTVAIIDTATDTVIQMVPVGPTTYGTVFTQVAMTPDGKQVYVTSQEGKSVVVIDTASNTIVKTVLVGTSPDGVAVTPDGAHVYVSNQGSNSVSVIDTASNTVVATITVTAPSAISIISPPQGVPFLSFTAKLGIDLDRKPSHDAFHLGSSLTLSGTANDEIHPDTEPVKLQVGPFIATIPIGSFRRHGDRSYRFEGVIDDVRLEARIEQTGSLRYRFSAEAKGANLSGITNPVQVSLGIGDDAGLTSVKARFDRDHQVHDEAHDK